MPVDKVWFGGYLVKGLSQGHTKILTCEDAYGDRQTLQGTAPGTVRGHRSDSHIRQSVLPTLKRLLEEHGFGEFTERQCRAFVYV